VFVIQIKIDGSMAVVGGGCGGCRGWRLPVVVSTTSSPVLRPAGAARCRRNPLYAAEARRCRRTAHDLHRRALRGKSLSPPSSRLWWRGTAVAGPIPELSMGWADPWVGLGWVEIFQLLVGWVGFGPLQQKC